MNSEQGDKDLIRKALLQIKSLKLKIEEFENRETEAIAIVGMACRFPGNVSDPESFWELLKQGKDGITDIPEPRWNVDEYFNDDPSVPGKMYTRKGGFISDVDQFDASFFGISPREADNLDPQQRLLTEVSWEALENAACTDQQLKRSKTGVFVGICNGDYAQKLHDLALEEINAYMASGNAFSMAAGRLSYILGAQGPSLSLDTSCSSSLVAVHLACKSLRDKESNMAIAAGVNNILYPLAYINLSKSQMLAADGRCKAFDEKADGYVRGEGCGVIILKRLSDAIKNKDKILGLIAGSATNHDGPSGGLTVPNGPAQQAVIKSALANAKVTANNISYVEAHGTGTALGDPIELGALGSIFADSHNKKSPLYVGAVKTNIGHLEAAAGIAGLIKTCLSLQKEAIAPHLHFDTPNSHVDWDNLPIKIPTELTPWKRGDQRRLAGVSSFGFSGTNAHIILEEAPLTESLSPNTPEREFHLLCLSAKTEQALKCLVLKYQDYFKSLLKQAEQSDQSDSAYCDISADINAGNISYTSHIGRSHFKHRLSLVGKNISEWLEQLDEYQGSEQVINGQQAQCLGLSAKVIEPIPKIGFLYTGQGSQYPDMGKNLYDTEAVFRDSLHDSQEILKDLLAYPLTEVLYGKHQNVLSQTEYTQPALFAIEIALTALWKSWGIQPDYVLGHSLGEYVAACVSGVMTIAEGLSLVAERGRLMQTLAVQGGMLSVLGDENIIQEVLTTFANNKFKNSDDNNAISQENRDDSLADPAIVEISAYNAPGNLVLSGQNAALEQVDKLLIKAGIKTRTLNVSTAFHSTLVEPMLDDFSHALNKIQLKKPTKTFVSALTGKLVGEEVTQASYWTRHIREAVNFRAGVQTLRQAGVSVLIELGPAPVLSALAEQTLEQSIATESQQNPHHAAIACLPSVRKNFNNHHTMLTTLAELYRRGVAIQWESVDQGYDRYKVNLPTYAFQHQRYWIDVQSSPSASVSASKKSQALQEHSHHPLLGEQLILARPNPTDTWFSQTLSPNSPAYLKSHQVFGQTIYPAAAYIEMALSAGQQLLKTEQLHIVDLRLLTVLSLKEPTEVQTLLQSKESGEYEFQIFSQQHTEQSSEWVTHASGLLQKNSSTFTQTESTRDLQAIKTRISHTQDVSGLYAQYEQIGIEYGPDFRTITTLDGGDGESLARLTLPSSVSETAVDEYHLHPTLLDGAFQSLLGGNQVLSAESTYLPVEISELNFYPHTAKELWCHASIQDFDEHAKYIHCHVTIMDETGALVVEVNGLTLKKISKINVMSQQTDSITRHFYEQQWKSCELLNTTTEINPEIDNTINIETNDNLTPLEVNNNATPINNRLQANDLSGGKSLAALTRKSCLLISPDNDTSHSLIQQMINKGYHFEWIDSAKIETSVDNITTSIASLFTSITDVLYAPDLSQNDFDEKTDQTIISQQQNTVACKSLQNSVDLLALTQQLISNNNSISVWLLTQQAQSVVTSDQLQGLMQSPLWGMGKVIALEHPELHCKRIDIDRPDPKNISQYICNEFNSQNTEDQIAYRAGQRYVARLAAYHSTEKTPPKGVWRLGLDERGTLDNIYYQSIERRPPQADEVEVKIHAAGMNFRDVLNALGMYPGDPGLLGGECAGDVVSVGKNVTHLNIGDRVLGIAPGSFSQYVTVPANMFAKMASNLTYAQAAGLPIVYLTTHYTLNYLGNLQAGEKILIHAATGGVGQAAIQLARKAGAEIYATASPSKWQVLDQLGVTHKMNSRSLDFVEEIEQGLGEAGIDLVLNSLSGDYIEKTASLIKEQGRFIEIGKRDVWTVEEMTTHSPHINYHLVDLVDVCEKDPQLIQTMYNELMSWFESGELVAADPTQFPISQYEDAFRFMQQAKHTGKIVLQLPEQTESIDLKNTASYLVTGGLGGLGRLVTEWLINKGAGHVVLLSRQAADASAQQFIEKFSGKVSVLVTDVADFAQLQAAIQTTEQMGQLKGIIHAAGVLDDGVIRQQSPARFNKVFSAKVQGSWNLHQCTIDKALDFFVMFSSTASLMGSPGQSNYAAANSFMDSFAAWRQAQSFPALSVNWGPWDQAGMAADTQKSMQAQWARQGIYTLQSAQCDEYFTALFLEPQTKSQIAVLNIDWQTFAEQDSSHLSTQFLEQFSGHKDPSACAHWVNEILASPAQQQLPNLLTHLKSEVGKVLNIKSVGSIGLRERMFDLGMDSLMAVELSNRLKKDLGTDMPSTLIFDYPTVEALAGYLAEEVLGLGQTQDKDQVQDKAKFTESTIAVDDEMNDLFDELDEMSDEDASSHLT
ncbi:Polyketide synthase modules and related proteins [hydrothermal vent metagenome]|uniref:Polyketide synthase modules and related proteins n=1 Tax=hydrothermal vent metagenome TaxID=652676 RepID=A0A3B0ZHL8_9ZZZZ